MNRQRNFLILLIGISFLLIGMMLAPYAAYILMGLLLAYVGMPLHKKLTKHISGGFSAGAIIILTVLAAVIPVGLMAGKVVTDAQDVLEDSQNLGIDFDPIERELESLTGRDYEIDDGVERITQRATSWITGSLSGIIGFASGLAIGLTMMFFSMFYGLKDGKRVKSWTKSLDIMPQDIQEELYRKTGRTTMAVVKGHVIVAIAQGIITGIGLWLAGVPNIGFWTLAMIFLGFIPLVGTMLVWVPASAWLVLTAQIPQAAFLVAWGLIVVGAVDNVLRPYLVDEEVNVHPIYVLFGVIGGISAFGIIGLFLGPVIFGVSKNLLQVYAEKYDAL
ncbi:MAG: AI-2E family transporter [Nanohaloarchaea archaeon]|nr:AI-2E family transporter [Candidatus Nanohaloarchaea archaeon]